MSEPRALLGKLFEYIGEQLKQIDPRGFNLAKLGGFKLTALNLKNLPGIELNVQTQGDHIWLKVSRLEAKPSPRVLDKEFLGLIEVKDNPSSQPPEIIESALIARIISNLDTDDENKKLEAEQDLRERLNQYLEDYRKIWLSWSDGEKPRRETIRIYSELFSLNHQIEAEEATKPIELIWGVGVASWQMKFDGQNFDYQYPLLSQAVEISIDAKTMAIEVRPRAIDARVEMEVFVACSIDGAPDIEKRCKSQLSSRPDKPLNPFDASTYQDVLMLMAGGLDSKGVFEESIEVSPLPTPGENFLVSDSWAIFSRSKTNNYLLDDLERLKDRLASGCDIPVGPLALVTPPSDEIIEYEPVNFRGVSSRGAGLTSSNELYFPLPYNDEQVMIIQRLERSSGVTVQGPPGTGKTHTIANIICHYLATGKRVLVTSRGEPALKVLQSKIPEEVRDLTVALLTNDREGVRQFQGAIESIQHRVSQIQPEHAREEINLLKNNIDRVHSELIAIDKRIDEIAIAQLSEIEIDGQQMRAQKMAELVIGGSDKYGWFEDDISLDPRNAPPLSEQEVSELREARRLLHANIIYVQSKIPEADLLPSGEDIVELHGVLSRIKELDGDELSGKLRPLKAITTDVLNAAKELLDLVEESKAVASQIEQINEEWPYELREKCKNHLYKAERAALEALFTEIDELISARAAFLQRPVEISESSLNQPKVLEAILRGAATGKPFGLMSAIGSGDVKNLVGQVKVAGLTPKSSEDWQHIEKYFALHNKLISFSTRWNQFAESLGIPRLDAGISSLRKIESIALIAKQSHLLATYYDIQLLSKSENVFKEIPHAECNGGVKELDVIRNYLVQHLTRASLARATSNLSSLQQKMAGCSGPVTDSIKDFIERELGNQSIESSRIAAKYAELISELRIIGNLSSEIAVVKDLTKKIENAGGIEFALRLRSVPVSSTGQDAIFPSDWKQAWNWARIRKHLESIEARSELVQMYSKRRDLENNLSRLYKEMVSKEAWLATKRNATARVLQALAGYATAIRKIGQGTGPNAHRYRRDARMSMLEAAGAVPCWIMSHAKISESMPADFGAFDLVIVDEASQSDLWALPAIARGKKILVVGDDKQVSPDAGFRSSTQIDDLITRFLQDMPYKAEMTPEKSLYDLAARVFAGQQVMLREHFRCVPPIISYSNKVFYQGAIQPLRIPKASERLDPPLIDVYVEGGYRNSTKNTNLLEAEAISDEITAILANPAMRDRTIGVVSLLGFEQAKLIDSIVRKNNSATELMHREFECGDARTFQGSERDIIFLSMVVDSQKAQALSGNQFEQRFNVAASRARDRMYLYRSVEAKDLSSKDLRLSLLEHFDKPLLIDKDEVDSLISLCDSGFEREVFTLLTDRGYKVTPQVKSSSFKIDMVVEGSGDARLAIELDGDDFHGPDRWQADMNRQRILERAGWTFWRCFASTWSLNKDEIFAELISRLSAMGIEPIGALDSIPSLVEKRVWRKEVEISEGLLSEGAVSLDEGPNDS